MELYPLIFEPILKDRIWGGSKLKEVLGKDIPNGTTGESWELSGVDGDISVVKNGAYAGDLLTSLITRYPDEMLGKKLHGKFGQKFPLLFKFLDAKDKLSIQVHPNDELAMKRHNSFGKTEMWYVMQADEGAKLIVGFKHDSSAEEYLEHLNRKDLIKILNEVEVKAGDMFFLETGTIHAIGGGIMIAEIQQTSDITYRVYDWDRTDANGNSRELHVDQALDAMNYHTTDTRREYTNVLNTANIAVDSPYFKTAVVPLAGTMEEEKDGSSFTVYICTDGDYIFRVGGQNFHFKKGDTILVPAALKEYALVGEATLLEISIS